MILVNKKSQTLIGIVLFFLLFFSIAVYGSGITIVIQTDTDESITLSGSWELGGSTDWEFIGEDPLPDTNDSNLIYRDFRRVTHFYGYPGIKDIHIKPHYTDRLNGLFWKNQNLVGTIPEGLTELEKFTRLDLSKNRLSGTIPNYIGDISELVRLSLSYNNFSGEIPAEIGNLEKLEVLRIDNNNLSGEIPAEIGNLEKLKELHLENNHISNFQELPDGSFVSLESLSLKNNKLENLPNEMTNFYRLFSLDLKNNRLQSLFELEEDEEINLNSLEYLNASKNIINCFNSYQLPYQIGNISNMKTLRRYHQLRDWHPKRLSINLNYNCLETIPDSILNLSALDSLKIDNNALIGFFDSDNDLLEKGIPDNIGNLENDSYNVGFRILSLYNNRLTGEISSNIGDLTNLEILRLQNNNLMGNIPAELLSLQSLTNLNIENNNLEMPDSTDEVVADSLIRANFSRNKITRLPENFSAPKLEFFSLEKNNIEELPERFGDNFGESLAELTLNKNALRILPESFTKLKSLNYLDLGGNILSNVPEPIFELSNLKYLNLSRQSGNELTSGNMQGQMAGEIPETFSNLSNLNTFLIQNNQIDSFSENINWQNINSLEYIYAQNNQLQSIPENIGDLLNLQRIYLNNNRISSIIPDKLTNISTLERFYAQNNQITGSLPQNNFWVSLERFLVDNNNITGGIDQSFTNNFHSLIYFSISKNNLNQGISEIGQMHSLRWWDIALNQGIGSSTGIVGEIPSEIGSLSSLQIFDFNNNRITSVPDEINNNSSLISLLGFENQISSFSSSVNGLNNLRHLDFHNSSASGGNKIAIMPSGLESLSNLQYLSFGENKETTGTVLWEDWVSNFPDDALFLNNNKLDGFLSDGMLSEIKDMVFFDISNNNFSGSFPTN